jgi:hypothetical protein
LVAGTENYQPVTKEDFAITQDTETPLELTVRLQKR